MPQRVLVIGGMGAIGIWVVRELIERGEQVVVLDTQDQSPFLVDLNGRFEFVAGDITDLPHLVQVMRNRDIGHVIHLAAVLFQCDDNPPLGFSVNTMGTLNVLEAARAAAVARLVFTSAKAVYGQIRGEHAHPTYRPVTEDAPQAPDSIYGASKLAAERAGLHYARRFGVDFVALRLASLYGPGRLSRHGALAITSEMVERARAQQPMKVAQGGEQGEDILYTRDAARGIVCAAFAPTPRDRVFNISSGRPTSLHEFAGAVRGLYPDAEIDIGPGLDYWAMGKQYYSVLDSTRAREQLDFTPRFSLDAGIRDYVRILDALKAGRGLDQ
ncbi:MAG: NAD-dependent epimerase/dehydratase family protein [Bradyrhizobiaceae bacterium]|nr:NAD-dependent epimerase/dehydratase family protein [Bradyrhizobiaceae bacterium]